MTTFILHGGFNKELTDADSSAFYRDILDHAPEVSKILLVPFAKDEDEEKIGKAILKVSGDFNRVARPGSIEIHVANKESFQDQIAEHDVIYCHGGVSLRLLDFLQQNPDIKDLLTGKVVAGESAGANVWCKYFYSPHADAVFEGLGFLPLKIIPHYKPEYAHKLDNVAPDLETLLLPEYVYKVFTT